ncbi:MAG: cyanophycin synthetase, partial [Acidobacteriota bacterium]
FDLAYGGQSREVELPIHGLYNVENCLAAAACVLELGLSLDDVAAAVASFKPASMRGVVHRLKAGPTVIDDSYNANPDAVARALESARLLPARRRIAVLGDMLELGPEEADFHRQVGKRAAELGFELVIGVGELSRHLLQGVEEAGGQSKWFASSTAVASWLGGRPTLVDRQLGVGDLVLVKGSRGVGLDKVVGNLVDLYGEAD